MVAEGYRVEQGVCLALFSALTLGYVSQLVVDWMVHRAGMCCRTELQCRYRLRLTNSAGSYRRSLRA